MDFSTNSLNEKSPTPAHDCHTASNGDTTYLDLYKGLLSNLLESCSESRLSSMIQLLKGINISNQGYFLKLLSMESESDYYMIRVMEDYIKNQENYYNDLLSHSKYLTSLEKRVGVNERTLPFSQNKDETISLWDKNGFIMCNLSGFIEEYSPVMAIGFKGKKYAKGPKWANTIANKVNEAFYPITRQFLDSFIIFYYNRLPSSSNNDIEIAMGDSSLDFNIQDCQIEYIIPRLDNPLYESIIEASKHQFFVNSHDLSSCVKTNISNLYEIIEELEEWALNYPDWPKKSDDDTLRGLVSVHKSSELISMVISLQIDVSSAIRNGLVRSVKSVSVELAHSELNSDFQSCSKLQNAIINRLSNGEKLVQIISQSIEYFKLT